MTQSEIESAVAHPGRGAGRPRKGERPDGEIRTALLAESARLLADASEDDAFSLRAVARAVGISAPSIYHYFPSREALIAAVLDHYFQELGAAVRTAIEQAASPAERLLRGCVAYCQFGFDQPGPYRAIFGVRPLDAGGNPIHDTQGAAAFGILVSGIANCMTARIAPDGNAHTIALDVWCAMHGMVLLRRALPDMGWQPLEVQLDQLLHDLTGIPLQLADVEIEDAAGCKGVAHQSARI